MILAGSKFALSTTVWGGNGILLDVLKLVKDKLL
jgi:hypothetical protein